MKALQRLQSALFGGNGEELGSDGIAQRASYRFSMLQNLRKVAVTTE